MKLPIDKPHTHKLAIIQSESRRHLYMRTGNLKKDSK